MEEDRRRVLRPDHLSLPVQALHAVPPVRGKDEDGTVPDHESPPDAPPELLEGEDPESGDPGHRPLGRYEVPVPPLVDEDVDLRLRHGLDHRQVSD